jgi:hypothetical protein
MSERFYVSHRGHLVHRQKSGYVALCGAFLAAFAPDYWRTDRSAMYRECLRCRDEESRTRSR